MRGNAVASRQGRRSAGKGIRGEVLHQGQGQSANGSDEGKAKVLTDLGVKDEEHLNE